MRLQSESSGRTISHGVIIENMSDVFSSAENFVTSKVVEIAPHRLTYRIKFANDKVVSIRRNGIQHFLSFLADVARQHGEVPLVQSNVTFLFGALYQYVQHKEKKEA